jgi:hypothetical protein
VTDKSVDDMTEAEVDAALADAYAQAHPNHIAAAFVKAVAIGEMEAAIGLLGMLTRKDPHLADLIVRTIKYRPAVTP